MTGRDEGYPAQSRTTLGIAGFSSGDLTERDLYLEPTVERNYMTFIMDDTSAIFVKAEDASMRRIQLLGPHTTKRK